MAGYFALSWREPISSAVENQTLYENKFWEPDE